MPGYIENLTFGMAPINLVDAETTTKYVGKKVELNKNTYSTAAAAKGLDWGSKYGIFDSKMTINIRLIQEIAAAAGTTITFSICQSDDDATFEDGWMTLKVPVSELNGALRKPIMFTPASTMKRYICLKLQPSAAITAGQILVTAEYKGY